MVEYTCQKCSRIFTHKWNYIYHTQKKKNGCTDISDKLKKIINKKSLLDNKFLTTNIIPNKIISVFENKTEDDNQEKSNDTNTPTIFNPDLSEPICVYCNKHFVTNSHRNRHMSANCCIRKKYIELIKVLDKEIENLYLENKFLRNKFMNLFGDKHMFTFGTEKFIGYDINLIIDAIKNPYKGIPDLIEKYHFNPVEIRYHNIRIKNPRSIHLEIYNGVNWIIETKDNVIITLLRTYKDIVDMEVENLTDRIQPIIINHYNDFSEYIDNWIAYLIYDKELSSFQKKYAKQAYNKIFTAIEIMLINAFRKDIFNKMEEDNDSNI